MATRLKDTYRSEKGTDFFTPDEDLQRVLDHLRETNTRVRIIFDGPFGEFGQNYGSGYINRSPGNPNCDKGGLRLPVLIHRKNSKSGKIIKDSMVVKIESARGYKVFWRRKRL